MKGHQQPNSRGLVQPNIRGLVGGRSNKWVRYPNLQKWYPSDYIHNTFDIANSNRKLSSNVLL